MKHGSLLRNKAEAGDATGQFVLGTMYDKGQGVEQDYGEAAKWYRKAAEHGRVEAQYQIGFMYEMGRGVKQDDAEAYAWYNLSGANGHDLAAEQRDELEKQMSPQQIADAEKRTEELKKLIAEKQANSE